jgi:magnesium-transporting ATPase (P-type)
MTTAVAPTRTMAEIVRANALFGLVLIANTLVGIVQEVRAKRTLERLAVISAPTARVVRIRRAGRRRDQRS